MRINKPRGKVITVRGLEGTRGRQLTTGGAIRRSPPSTADEWVGRNLNKVQRFAGRWVAVTEHGIVADSRDFDDLYSKAKAQGVTNPLVFKVPTATKHPKVVSVIGSCT